MINHDFMAYMTPAIAADVTTMSPNIAAIGCILESAVNDRAMIIQSPIHPANIEKIAVMIFRRFIKGIIKRLATKCKQNLTN